MRKVDRMRAARPIAPRGSHAVGNSSRSAMAASQRPRPLAVLEWRRPRQQRQRPVPQKLRLCCESWLRGRLVQLACQVRRCGTAWEDRRSWTTSFFPTLSSWRCYVRWEVGWVLRVVRWVARAAVTRGIPGHQDPAAVAAVGPWVVEAVTSERGYWHGRGRYLRVRDGRCGAGARICSARVGASRLEECLGRPRPTRVGAVGRCCASSIILK